jgi:Phage related protein
MENIAKLLDKAKLIHKLPSDYKLALVMGIQPTSLGNYRTGKTLPDPRVITKICELTGDDPMVLAAEIEAERAKTTEARALWSSIAARLQGGMATAASVVMTCVLSLLFTLSTGVTNEAQASPLSSQNGGALYIMYSSFMTAWRHLVRRIVRLTGPIFATFACLFTGVQNEKAVFQIA